jgi:hypothetical protein
MMNTTITTAASMGLRQCGTQPCCGATSRLHLHAVKVTYKITCKVTHQTCRCNKHQERFACACCK